MNQYIFELTSELITPHLICRTSKIRAASAGDFSLLCFDLIGSLESPPSNLLRATRKPDVLVLSEIHG